jgi:3-hydroxyisobutyrate dehydrogenase-like beta-hydroxyacid dehydrogenase
LYFRSFIPGFSIPGFLLSLMEGVMAKLGFIGLGRMGGRVVKRLLDAGHTVVGYNRTQSKAQWLLDAGMQWANSPRQVVEQSDVVFSMVTNTASFQDICAGDNGVFAGLKPGSVYIDMSTIDVTVSREAAEQVAAKGAHMLDVPVSGNLDHVTAGTASLIVGGEEAIYEQVRPILLDITSKVDYAGGNGQAILMKIAINLSLAVQFLGFSEGVLLAEKNGISRDKAIKIWRNSAVASPATSHRAAFVLDKPEQAWFDVTMMQKDLRLALDLGRASEVSLPSVALSHELLTAARGMGLAHEDFSILFEVLARMSGLSQQ